MLVEVAVVKGVGGGDGGVVVALDDDGARKVSGHGLGEDLRVHHDGGGGGGGSRLRWRTWLQRRSVLLCGVKRELDNAGLGGGIGARLNRMAHYLDLPGCLHKHTRLHSHA